MRLFKGFKLRGLPTSILINKEGKEFGKVIGEIDFASDEFIKLLKANNINSTHKTLSSTKGHDCFLLEPELFEKELGKFI